MNTTKYLQTDSRWSQLPYPKSPCRLGVCGCGELSICNAIIEMEQYKNYTPITINPYCKQYADPGCEGTYHSGIPKMMKNYGLTEVKEHANMDSLWKELAKGDRVAIYLMGSRRGGSKRIHWTSSGHFVCSVGYKYKDSKHYVYVKDSYSNSKDRNFWISYEENMRGDVSRVWSGKLSGAKPSPSPSPAPTPSGKLVVDGSCGTATVKAMQRFFGTTVDGVISGQMKQYKSYYPSIHAIQFGKGGSAVVTALQKWLGLSAPYGIIGPNTTKAWQKKLRSLGYLAKNESIDGIFGVKSMKAWQECLNNGGKTKTSTTTTSKPTTSAPTVKPTTSTTTSTPTTTAKADKYKVIDVSEWQGVIDWAKVKADGVVGAIIRYADGDYLDKYFDRNMQMAKAQGLHIGAYIFSRASSKAGAEKEAQRLFDASKKYSPDLPLYIDLEDNKLKKYAETVAQAYISKIKALGGKPGVYANLNWWNNYLKKTAKLSFAMWLAQYNDKMTYTPKSYVGMWQYSSSGKVKGISGRVDMDWLYIPYWEDEKKTDPKPEPTPTPQGYQGKFPTYRLTKSNAEVKADACTWAKRIADNNDFHYGMGKAAHHNGCYYCGTQPKAKRVLKMWETTYCCNPFVGAAWAHGGGDSTAYKMCHEGKSWDFGKGNGSYHKSKLFDNLGHPAKSKLQAGDVLCNDGHVALYIGGGKIAEAGAEDDNVIHSKKWDVSIRVKTLSDALYKKFPRVYRYNSKVDCDRVILKGEYSTRVSDMQKFLVWYGYKIKVTGFYNSETYDAVVKFQETEMGKGQGDGSVGLKTIEAMKKVTK